MNIGFTSSTFNRIRDQKKIIEILKNTETELIKQTEDQEKITSNNGKSIICIEWSEKSHLSSIEDAYKVKQLCDKEKIKINSLGSYYRIGSCNTDKWEAICQKASVIKAESVRVWLGEQSSKKTDGATYNLLVNDTKTVCDIAEKYGLSVCAECHRNTYNDNTDAFLKISRDVDRANFKTYFQSTYKNLDYDLDRIDRTFTYIKDVHISFSECRREQFPKFDSTYIDKLITKLYTLNFNGTLLLEFTYLYPFFDIPLAFRKDMLNLCNKAGTKK